MNTFKKKALFAALTGLGAMGMVGSAQAVSLNPDGLGQVLIYPYYTVRADANGNAFNSLISVVNTTGVAKAVKVRFLEGKISQEVLDFNLYLSKEDVWTGAVVPTSDNTGAMLITNDTSCTAPPIPAAGVAFRPYQYTGINADLEDQTLNRTKEGYVEIIEMADIIAGTDTEKNVTHTNVGGVWMPFNCAAVRDGGITPTWASITTGSHLTTGTGGLFGSMTLINPNEAQDVAFEATALDAFYTGPNHLWSPSGSILPNLGNVNPKTSTVIDGTNVYITSSWDEGIDAVSAVLMNSTVYNEFVLEDAVAAKTDWVVTFPTKSHYYVLNTTTKVREVQYLFQNDFRAGGACDELAIAYFDREERFPASTDDFSPRPPTGRNSLCWEANVITFGPVGTASVLRAENRVTLPVSGYESGWAKFSFTGTGGAHVLVGDSATTSGTTQYVNLAAATPTVSTLSTITFTGLPMIGFAVQQFNNGQVEHASYGKIWASYAGRIAHRFSKTIQ
jgi:hypothetical protein